MPESLRAESNACLNANKATIDKQRAGSPVAKKIHVKKNLYF